MVEDSMIFPGELIQKAALIRELYPRATYDHRPFLTEFEPDRDWKMLETFRVGYACLNWAAAKIIQPNIIVEIGVGGGVAALAYLDACPYAIYQGLDNGQLGVERGFDFIADVRSKLVRKHATIGRVDGREVPRLPRADLIHIDGNHLYPFIFRDVQAALVSDSTWILVENCRDPQVAAAAFAAFFAYRQEPMEWAYFEDSWTGSMLFCTELPRDPLENV
jgi:hypothetical protein